jgi:ABC-2 type transport system ATP-binding protein
VLDLLNEVRERGHTVFLCTHYLQEVDRLCDRVGVLAEGRIVVEAGVRELRAPGTSVIIQVTALDLETRRQLEGMAAGVRTDATSVRITQNTPQLQAQVLRALLDVGVAVIALDPLESPLERLYLRAVRGELPQQPQPDLPPWTPTLPVPGGTPPLTLSLPALPAEQPARRTGDGDTLLNELLKRKNDADPGAGDAAPEEH